jgi:hypothetical protein
MTSDVTHSFALASSNACEDIMSQAISIPQQAVGGLAGSSLAAAA